MMLKITSFFKSNKYWKRIIVSFLLFLIILPGQISLALTEYETNPDFNHNYLLSDDEMTDYTSMTIEQIRDFSEKLGGTLDTYIDPQVRMPAYWIIWQAAQEFQISPKFLLTLLQKEQSLITDEQPTENQYNWATGYSCYGGICLDIYKGFANQVRAAARKFRNYYDDLNTLGKYQSNFYCTFTKWCVGLPKLTQDEVEILPQTKATAALYTYNPYRGNTVVDGYKIGANYNFWKIWNRWFESSTYRPNGTLLKSNNSVVVYLIKDGEKRPFSNFSALITRYDPKNIIVVDQQQLDQLPTGPAIKFPQYSLLQNEQGDIYLLVNDQLRQIASTEVFRTLGFNPEEVTEVTNQDLADLPLGAQITLSSAYPTGSLLRDKTTGGVYFVQSGVKYPIVSPEILKANYPDQTVLVGAASELEKYPKADPVKFKDGTLVKAKNDDKVYVISSGQKLHIKDENSFISRSYHWENIIETSAAALEIHPSGQSLEALATSTPALDIEEGELNELPAQP